MAGKRFLGDFFEARGDRVKSAYAKPKVYGLAFFLHALEGRPKRALRALGKSFAGHSLLDYEREKPVDDRYGDKTEEALEFKRQYGVFPSDVFLKFYLAAQKNLSILPSAASFLMSHEEVSGPAKHFFANRREYTTFAKRLAEIDESSLKNSEVSKHGKEIVNEEKACNLHPHFLLSTYLYNLAKLREKQPSKQHSWIDAIERSSKQVSKVQGELGAFLVEKGVNATDASLLGIFLPQMHPEYAAYHKPEKK